MAQLPTASFTITRPPRLVAQWQVATSHVGLGSVFGIVSTDITVLFVFARWLSLARCLCMCSVVRVITDMYSVQFDRQQCRELWRWFAYYRLFDSNIYRFANRWQQFTKWWRRCIHQVDNNANNNIQLRCF
jgi:hypothetical protein